MTILRAIIINWDTTLFNWQWRWLAALEILLLGVEWKINAESISYFGILGGAEKVKNYEYLWSIVQFEREICEVGGDKSLADTWRFVVSSRDFWKDKTKLIHHSSSSTVLVTQWSFQTLAIKPSTESFLPQIYSQIVFEVSPNFQYLLHSVKRDSLQWRNRNKCDESPAVWRSTEKTRHNRNSCFHSMFCCRKNSGRSRLER
jgi:hypothetical protein